jgi:hypothetical protein
MVLAIAFSGAGIAAVVPSAQAQNFDDGACCYGSPSYMYVTDTGTVRSDDGYYWTYYVWSNGGVSWVCETCSLPEDYYTY